MSLVGPGMPGQPASIDNPIVQLVGDNIDLDFLLIKILQLVIILASSPCPILDISSRVHDKGEPIYPFGYPLSNLNELQNAPVSSQHRSTKV
jgi:hypothetical protein